MAQNCWNLDIYVNFTSHYTVHTLLLKNPALSLLEQLIGEVNWTYHNSFSIIDYFNPILYCRAWQIPNGTYNVLFTKCRWMPLLKVSSAFNEESTNSAFSNAEKQCPNIHASESNNCMQLFPTIASSAMLPSFQFYKHHWRPFIHCLNCIYQVPDRLPVNSFILPSHSFCILWSRYRKYVIFYGKSLAYPPPLE